MQETLWGRCLKNRRKMSKTRNSTLTSTLYFLNYLKQRTALSLWHCPCAGQWSQGGRGRQVACFKVAPQLKECSDERGDTEIMSSMFWLVYLYSCSAA